MKKVKTFIQQQPHSLLLLYWVFYIIYFIVLEKVSVPAYILYSPLDDMIPFHELFIIPYMMWFPLLVIPLLYFMFKDKKVFQDLCFFMFTGMTISLLIYTFFPNGLALRVDITRDNLCANIVKLLQGIDSPTNVCPSIHVASTLAIQLVILKYRSFQHPIIVKGSTLLISILIILSTMFLKQHSIIDVIAGIALSTGLYFITYHTKWRAIFHHTILKKAFA